MYRLFFLVLVWPLVVAYSSDAQEKIIWGNLSGRIVDENDKPVAEAIVYLLPSRGSLPIHADDKVSKDIVIQIPSGRNFDFRVQAYYARNASDEKAPMPKLTIVGDKVQNHAMYLYLHPRLAFDVESAELLKLIVKRKNPHLLNAGSAYVAAGDTITANLKAPRRRR